MLHHEIYKSDNCDNKRFIVLLHGFGGNHKVFKKQIPVLRKYCNVLAIDLPSHYKGNKKLTEMKNSIQSIVAEILKILDNYSINRAIFMGLSLGTVFIKYIEQYNPEYIQAAILVGAIGTVGLFLSTTVRVLSKLGDKLPSHLVYKIFSKVIMPLKISKKSREIFCECAKELNKYEFKAYMNIFKEHFIFNKEFIKNEHSENLYISGISDKCFIQGIREEAYETDAELQIIESCGHIANIDQNNTFNELITIFLNKLLSKEDTNVRLLTEA